MADEETVATSDGHLRISHTPDLSVAVQQPRMRLTAGRSWAEVRYALDVSATGAGGALTIAVRAPGGRPFTALTVLDGRYELLPAERRDGRTRTWRMRIPGSASLWVLIVEHTAGIAPEELPDLLPAREDYSALDLAIGAARYVRRDAGALPPALDGPAVAGGGAFLPEPAAALAEVGANMPSEVHLHDVVPVEVRLSREEVSTFAHTSHDEQVIVMDPARPLDVVLVRRGFDLDTRESPVEPGRRSISLPSEDAAEAVVVFWLIAAQEGEGEVQVVVRQDHPLPLATLRLTSTVLPASDRPMNRQGAEAAALERSPKERLVRMQGVTPFVNPNTLVIDENLVGVTSHLSFDLVLPGIRRQFARVVEDKSAILQRLFGEFDAAWRDVPLITDPQARQRAFQECLRMAGSRLARDVLPPELLELLRDCLDQLDELAVVTSGETDIPWELIHLGGPDSGEDLDGRGFLGRTGLVRWVYSTRHPTALSIRSGRGHYLIPEYVDPRLVLDSAGMESSYLGPFGATPVDPPDAAGFARVIASGEVDLLHFAGHGFSNVASVPPVREMALADYRLGSEPVPGADRSRIAFSLEDLRRALPSSPFDPGPLIFLNACGIGQAPSTNAEMGGFAETFLRGGAGAFVGCLWSVGDQPASEFVAAFYKALDAGHTIAQATLAGREAARRAGDLTWLAYTVYAHPDARLADRPVPPPEPDPSPKGPDMTTTAAARKAPPLTAAELQAIHPFVICMEDGRLAEGESRLPTGVGDFETVKADIDDLFARRLPDFITMHGKPVPMMLWAHGGLVDKAGGLRVAHTQVAWWQANGVFPVHFVWRTGLAESLWDAVKDNLPGRARGFGDLFDEVIEAAVRAGRGKEVWGAMKTTAKLASEKDTGGAWYFAQKLGEFVRANPGSVTVHTAGHSAGSIFHSHLIPELLSAGVPSIASLNLMAPAIRVDEFKQRILKKSVFDKIEKTTLFTMSEVFEKLDTCIGIYKKSLLYLIRGALENESNAEILGLQECLQRDKALGVLLGQSGSGDKGEVMWSLTVGGGPRTSSRSRSHGGFDNDADTMNSLARRVIGNDRLTVEFGSLPRTRDIDEDTSPWVSEQEAIDYINHRDSGVPRDTRRRALCIGINEYPLEADRLGGCVADARAWKQELEHAGFAVEIIEDGAATQQSIVQSIQDLIVNSRAGDVLVVQYSGHGTTIDDLDGDDLGEAIRTGETKDEALCPVDFRDGELLIDDDLGELWDQLPEGVSLTVFFDSCHSGGAQRAVLPVPVEGTAGRKARLVRMTRENVEAYKARRGGLPQATRSLDGERSVYFGACQATQLAYENNGQGDFTRLALPRLREFLGKSSNQQYYDAVLAGFANNPAQQPVLLPPHLASRTFLAPTPQKPGSGAPAAEVEVVTEPPAEPMSRDGATRREQAVASILRGVADLIES